AVPPGGRKAAPGPDQGPHHGETDTRCGTWAHSRPVGDGRLRVLPGETTPHPHHGARARVVRGPVLSPPGGGACPQGLELPRVARTETASGGCPGGRGAACAPLVVPGAAPGGRAGAAR
ncbi:Hypothetical protein SCLAV_0703, partial [Streptomyces clavuligerus]